MEITSQVGIEEGGVGYLNIPLGVADVMFCTWPTLPGEFPQILTHVLPEDFAPYLQDHGVLPQVSQVTDVCNVLPLAGWN